MRSATLIILFIILAVKLQAQNVFPQKLEGCGLSRFCLDCGNPKATYDTASFMAMTDALNNKYHFNSGSGKTGFQVLVDSDGVACVISHTDATNSQITKKIIKELGDCKWIPALDHDKPVTASINVFFQVSNGELTGQIERVDIGAMSENMKTPGTPQVYNKSYTYTNPSLSSYEITVWQKENSNLPNDMGIMSAVDRDDIVWCSTYNGFAKLDGNSITAIDETNSPFSKKENIRAIGVDAENNKWVYGNKAIYKYDNATWQRYDSPAIGIKGAYNIVPTTLGEMLFCSDSGLLVYKNGKGELIDDKKIQQLPSNRILYAYRDKKQRLWIGTFGGTIMIDANNVVTDFNAGSTPIKNTCISAAAEDEEGNIYFALFSYERSTERDKPQEGIAVLTKDGQWVHYNDTNSGLPSNHINGLLYDRFEKVLWIGTNATGLVRYDLKSGWEDYHNQNSKAPSIYIFKLSQDSKGSIYASTFFGVMRIKKKE